MVEENVSLKQDRKDDVFVDKIYGNVPQLRFPEFEDGWGKNLLENIAFINIGFTPATNDENNWNGDIPWLSIADLKEKYLKNTSKNITKKGTKNKEIIKKGTLVMSFKLTIGKLGILDKDMYTNEAICNLNWKNKNISTEFMYYYLNSINILKYGSQAAKGITLNKETLKTIPIKIPSLTEQEKIANFLSKIDEKIMLLEKTYSLCQTKTKFLLEKLLNMEFRFSEFEDEWRSSILRDNITTIPSKNFQIKKTDILKDGKIPVIDQGKEKIAGYSNENDKLFKEVPIICFGDHTTNLKFVDRPFIIGGDSLKLIKSSNKDLDLLFLFYAMKKNNISQEGYKRHFSILNNINIKFPNLEEQKKISKFLNKLYKQLELINKKINEFKKFKKFLLDILFI